VSTAIYREGYFLSEESEKAANWDMLQRLKSERSRLSALQDQAQTMGNQLDELGRVLKNPAWTLVIRDEQITGTSSVARGAKFSVPLSILNPGTLSRLIQDTAETKHNIDTLSERLKNDLP